MTNRHARSAVRSLPPRIMDFHKEAQAFMKFNQLDFSRGGTQKTREGRYLWCPTEQEGSAFPFHAHIHSPNAHSLSQRWGSDMMSRRVFIPLDARTHLSQRLCWNWQDGPSCRLYFHVIHSRVFHPKPCLSTQCNQGPRTFHVLVNVRGGNLCRLRQTHVPRQTTTGDPTQTPGQPSPLPTIYKINPYMKPTRFTTHERRSASTATANSIPNNHEPLLRLCPKCC
ncbi:hypothetical protein JAAARDRAFT_29853 [Jaapia argillacea MUCL 33604]|uniref:Uncharacterized protein n=1 Tax=Jaapia argillacea MUCL 33604 TaxID=933084 RepID=A0A067QJU9_9AGAM|nr:hypothetical protein JAAARDRAFT_29853 [Jaapia argillacea MUCL 33604]